MNTPVTTSLHVPAIMKVNDDVSLINLYSVQTRRKAMMAPTNIRPRLIKAWLGVLKYTDDGSVAQSLSHTRLSISTVPDMTGVSASRISRGPPSAPMMTVAWG